MLGLGLIENRQGYDEKALETVRESQRLFRIKAGSKPSSLIAKAGMSIVKILLKLATVEQDPAKRQAMEMEAVEVARENVTLFEVTAGDDSPLTASALRLLGEGLLRQKKVEEATTSFARSYNLEVQKDAFNLMDVMEVHNLLVGVHMAAAKTGGGLDRKAFKTYVPTIELGLKRVRDMPQT